MTVSYWLNLGIRFMQVEPFNLQHRSVLECLAEYTAVQLRVEVCNGVR